jgi:hypothetical protein
MSCDREHRAMRDSISAVHPDRWWLAEFQQTSLRARWEFLLERWMAHRVGGASADRAVSIRGFASSMTSSMPAWHVCIRGIRRIRKRDSRNFSL